MKKKLIKLTENDLHRIVRNSVNRIIKESSNPYWGTDEYSKIKKRNANYIDDIYDDDEPTPYDSISYEDDPEGEEYKIASRRRMNHMHKRNNKIDY